MAVFIDKIAWILVLIAVRSVDLKAVAVSSVGVKAVGVKSVDAKSRLL